MIQQRQCSPGDRRAVLRIGRNDRRWKAVHAFFVLVMLLSAPGALRAEQGRSYLDVSGGYTTGDFGTPVRSDLFYVSTAFGYVSPVYDVALMVPYLFLSNNGGGVTNSESGIGDINLRGGRVLLPEGRGGFSIDGSLSVKLPTADKNKGLGTGETDYGAFLGVHQRFGRNKVSFHSGYIIVGQPASVTYNNIYLYGVGISRILDNTELYASFEGRQAMIPGEKNPQEIYAGFFHILNADYSIKGTAFKGLNNGGPDFGLNFGVVRWF